MEPRLITEKSNHNATPSLSGMLEHPRLWLGTVVQSWKRRSGENIIAGLNSHLQRDIGRITELPDRGPLASDRQAHDDYVKMQLLRGP